MYFVSRFAQGKLELLLLPQFSLVRWVLHCLHKTKPANVLHAWLPKGLQRYYMPTRRQLLRLLGWA